MPATSLRRVPVSNMCSKAHDFRRPIIRAASFACHQAGRLFCSSRESCTADTERPWQAGYLVRHTFQQIFWRLGYWSRRVVSAPHRPFELSSNVTSIIRGVHCPVPVDKSRYFIRRKDGDQQAIVLYTNGSTVIWDKDEGRRGSSNGDRFDDWCNESLNEGYVIDDHPDWEAPPDP
jgi:hypothetical protein